MNPLTKAKSDTGRKSVEIARQSPCLNADKQVKILPANNFTPSSLTGGWDRRWSQLNVMIAGKFIKEDVVNKVSESMWSGAFITIPMADVQHTEKHFNGEQNLIGGYVITKHTKKNAHGDWDNAIWLHKPSFESFMKAWCYYRHEIEGGAEAFLMPESV